MTEIASLSDAELDELQALLDQLAGLTEGGGFEDAVPLVSEVDGFLTALVVSTAAVEPAEWWAALFPGMTGTLPEEAAGRLTELVLARKAEIAGALLKGQAAFGPIYDIDGRNDDVLWEIWMAGFDSAMQLRLPAWTALRDSEDADVSNAFADVASLVLFARGEKPASRDDRELAADAPDLIPELAELLFCRQRGLPTVLDAPAPQQPVRVAKVGRNDPCPCGSGKKHKKCCLA